MRGRKKGTPKTGGREPNKPNKITTELRERLKGYIEKEIDFIEHNRESFDDHTRLALFTKILSLVLPHEIERKKEPEKTTQPIIIFTPDRQLID